MRQNPGCCLANTPVCLYEICLDDTLEMVLLIVCRADLHV